MSSKAIAVKQAVFDHLHQNLEDLQEKRRLLSKAQTLVTALQAEVTRLEGREAELTEWCEEHVAPEDLTAMREAREEKTKQMIRGEFRV